MLHPALMDECADALAASKFEPLFETFNVARVPEAFRILAGSALCFLGACFSLLLIRAKRRRQACNRHEHCLPNASECEE
jgi:hypothetical protein